MNNQVQWLKSRCGCISASELKHLTSASGKIVDGNIAYIRQKRFERNFGYPLPIKGRALQIGNEHEPYAVEWLRREFPWMKFTYAQECDEIPFWRVDWAKFGASPDIFTEDERIVVDTKVLAGNDMAYLFCDPYTSRESKVNMVLKDHRDQIIGLMLANEKVQEVWIVKYLPKLDDNELDNLGVLDSKRGFVFKFQRKDFGLMLDATQLRIILYDQFIDEPCDPTLLKQASLVDGVLQINT